ncbi:AbrB/MazE/SpoVT family DNA-binding domain-containing protein [Roseicella frigidaeris]|uniref:AbrB/MazE/SpoVT family DNA-binding domain-containing protein n=1 Tax=Roseicella frigidaeris TaxID=2230885 RepID=A0A327MAL7_9PROT|nr:AbrB/MazE/SpoVT family DNA-binding domain-containing protein [Roseicella frigidaeris]RAI59496.1 AbrB/MazE/SpoVT family DNA-binding domain-containing protein [Roseicella frigidaeris]
MATLKLRAIGNSVGLVLPKELLGRLRVDEGDSLQVVETPDGSLLLRRHEPEIEEQLTHGRELMKRYRETFRILAK